MIGATACAKLSLPNRQAVTVRVNIAVDSDSLHDEADRA
jgi:hypothetical protein